MGSSQSHPAVYDHDARGILAMFVIVVTVATISRVASRIMQTAPLGIDDYLIYFTFVLNVALLGTAFALVDNGTISEIFLATAGPEDLSRMQNCLMAYGFLYILSNISVKLSGLFLLRRIFTMNEKWFRIGWWINVLFVFPGWATASLATTGIQAAQRSLLQSNLTKYGIPVTAALTALSDIMVLILPLRSIHRLKLPRGQKLGLSGIFALGLIATSVATLRAALSVVKAEQGWNLAYSSYVEIVMAAAEACASYLCACLPVTKPVMRKMSELAYQGSSMLSSLVGSGARSKFSSARSTSQRSESTFKSRAQHNGIVRTDQYEVETLPLKTLGNTNMSSNSNSSWN